MPLSEHIRVTDAAGACPPPFSDGHAPSSSWYALRVRAQCEFKVCAGLEAVGFETFLPTWSEDVQWSDRKKTIVRCLFPGYVFARNGDIGQALMTRGVVQILPNSLFPVAITDREIESVRTVVASKLHSEPCEFVAGELVTVESGALAGVTGVVVRTRGQLRVVVSIEILNRAVSVEVNAAALLKTSEVMQ